MRWWQRRETGTMVGLLLLCVALFIATPYFATVDNLRNVAEQSTVIGTLAIGMTFVIIAGGIDLSVGSVVALSGVVLAMTLRAGTGAAIAVALALLVGAATGAANGALVTIGRLPPFIATLGTMSVARGLALLLADGRPISGFPDGLRALATARWFGLPVSVMVMLGLFAIAQLVLTRTVLGRFTYAIGGNAEAARLAGIPVRGYTTGTYVIAGVSAALCATLLLARLNSAQPIAGIGYELDAIAAVVIGGTSLLGGSGSVLGTLLGALLMSVLRNGLNLLGVSSYIQQIAIGTVIVIAVLVDMALQRRLRHTPS